MRIMQCSRHGAQGLSICHFKYPGVCVLFSFQRSDLSFCFTVEVSAVNFQG